MKKILFIIILFLLITTLCFADVNVSGGIKYTSPTSTTTESPTAPSNPNTNDLWRNPETNVVYKYTGSEWKNIKSDAKMTKCKNDFKKELNQITDEHAKACMEILGKAFFQNCGEDL